MEPWFEGLIMQAHLLKEGSYHTTEGFKPATQGSISFLYSTSASSLPLSHGDANLKMILLS